MWVSLFKRSLWQRAIISCGIGAVVLISLSEGIRLAIPAGAIEPKTPQVSQYQSPSITGSGNCVIIGNQNVCSTRPPPRDIAKSDVQSIVAQLKSAGPHKFGTFSNAGDDPEGNQYLQRITSLLKEGGWSGGPWGATMMSFPPPRPTSAIILCGKTSTPPIAFTILLSILLANNVEVRPNYTQCEQRMYPEWVGDDSAVGIIVGRRP